MGKQSTLPDSLSVRNDNQVVLIGVSQIRLEVVGIRQVQPLERVEIIDSWSIGENRCLPERSQTQLDHQ